MTEREVILAAVAVALASVVAYDAPWWCIGAISVAAVATKRPLAVIVLLAVGAGTLAARAEVGLVVPHHAVEGIASIAADPQDRPGGLVVELRLDGHRYRSFVSGDPALALRRASVGEQFAVAGRTGELRGPWEWRASRHLAGRLTIETIHRVSGGAWWWRSANWLHRTVEAGLGTFSPEERALFLGVVLGDDRGQTDLDVFRFRSSGLAHITAVSGQNIAFVLVAASPVLRRLRLRWRWVVTVGLLCWFAVVTRMEPSVLRAVAMAIVAATAAWWGRYVSGLRVVSVAVVAVLFLDPLLVWSLGFRLSVAASVALVVLARPLARCLPGPRLVAEGVAVSLAAQVGTAPLLWGLSGSVPALGPVANLLAVPIAGWLMVWGVVTGPIAGLVGEPVASIIGRPSRAMVWWLSSMAEWFADPGLPRFAAFGVAGSSIGVVALVVRSRRGEAGHRRWQRTLAGVVVLGMLVCAGDAGGLGAQRVVDAPGLSVWSDGDASVLWIGSGADSEGALGSLLRCRCARLDVVVVTGGGRTTSAIVYDLRQVVEVGTVLATRPAEIRGAAQLVAGPIVVGAIQVDVDDDRGWAVHEVPAASP